MNALINLSTWWQRPDESVIAISADHKITAAEFRQRVSLWLQVLQSQSGQRWAVYHSDAGEFLAILCALWQLSKTACIPGDNLAGTVQTLQDKVDGFIGEFATATPEISPLMVAEPDEWAAVAADHPALEVYTSGSTGQPKNIVKTMRELETELAALQSLLAEQADVVLTTVSHQHLYGLTFRLLRPFCAQQAFCTRLLEYPEDLIAMAEQVGRFTLVSSPAHLARMNAQQDWHVIKDRCVDIYSSAAPLLRADSLKVTQCLEAPVKEIYGSSETGAIAWRCQQDHEQDALWQPLIHVQLQSVADNTLQVTMKEDRAVVMLADKVNFAEDGSFSLLGRVDQIVKVEGKRLSLTELENRLQQNTWVKQAKAVLLTRKRTETAIVTVLSAEGEQALEQLGRKRVIQELKQFLRSYFEAVLLPKRWRFVAQLPYNAQGKLPMSTLKSLFDDTACKWPELLTENKTETGWSLQCRLPAELMYFDGHFEQQAILPGVVQVHWAARFGQKLMTELQGQFVRMEAVKFQQVLLPEQSFILDLDFDAVKQKLAFQYRSDSGIHSSGRLCYA